MQILDIGTIDQHVDKSQQLIGVLRVPWRFRVDKLFVHIARIAPDGLFGVRGFRSTRQLQQAALVFRLHRLATQERYAIDEEVVERRQHLFGHLGRELFPVGKAPRFRLKAILAMMRAARDEQRGAHAFPIGNITVFDVCVVHRGSFQPDIHRKIANTNSGFADKYSETQSGALDCHESMRQTGFARQACLEW